MDFSFDKVGKERHLYQSKRFLRTAILLPLPQLIAIPATTIPFQRKLSLDLATSLNKSVDGSSGIRTLWMLSAGIASPLGSRPSLLGPILRPCAARVAASFSQWPVSFKGKKQRWHADGNSRQQAGRHGASRKWQTSRNVIPPRLSFPRLLEVS